MKQGMMLGLGVVAGALVIWLVLRGGDDRGKKLPENRSAVVVLDDESGACNLGFATKVFTVFLKTDQHTRWNIYNFCKTDATVKVDRFRRFENGECSSTAGSPFDGGKNEEEVKAGKKGKIDLKHRKDTSLEGDWCYDLLLNGRPVDPGLRFEPY